MEQYNDFITGPQKPEDREKGEKDRKINARRKIPSEKEQMGR